MRVFAVAVAANVFCNARHTGSLIHKLRTATACAITTTGAASETATPTKKKALDCRSHAPAEISPPVKRAKKAKKVGRFGPYPMFLVPCSSCTKQIYTSCKGKTPTCRTCLKKANAKVKADAKADAKTNANATRH